MRLRVRLRVRLRPFLMVVVVLFTKAVTQVCQRVQRGLRIAATHGALCLEHNALAAARPKKVVM